MIVIIKKYIQNEIFNKMEQVAGIEPATNAWEAFILPLNYTCKIFAYLIYQIISNLSNKNKSRALYNNKNLAM